MFLLAFIFNVSGFLHFLLYILCYLTELMSCLPSQFQTCSLRQLSVERSKEKAPKLASTNQNIGSITFPGSIKHRADNKASEMWLGKSDKWYVEKHGVRSKFSVNTEVDPMTQQHASPTLQLEALWGLSSLLVHRMLSEWKLFLFTLWNSHTHFHLDSPLAMAKLLSLKLAFSVFSTHSLFASKIDV